MKAVLKSIAASLFATGFASFFLLMIAMGVLAVVARVSSGQQYADIDPSAVVRRFGLPLAGAMFVGFFALAWKRFRHPQGDGNATR